MLPVILKQPKSVVVEANHVATFECTARGYGVLSITWKTLNSEMPMTANVAVTKSLNEITSILRIDRTIGYYEGYCYCVIENSVGQVNSSFAYCNVTGSSPCSCIRMYLEYLILIFYSTMPRDDHFTKTCCSTS